MIPFRRYGIVICHANVSGGAYAYKKGDSIKKHASIHKTSNHIFHTDIKNFFESIKFDMIKPINVKDYVQKALKSREFERNTKKTSFISKKYRCKVTGLILTNDGTVSIGTGKRNEIKKMVYKKLVHGEGNPEQILGFLSFLKDTEPYTYNKIIIKYSKYCKGDVIDNIANM